MANRSIHNNLTDTAIRKTKPKEKAYTLPDGNGLQLLIKTNGHKVWEVRYTLHSKARKTTVGTYPTVSLKSARVKSEEYRVKAKNGLDPVEENKTEKLRHILKEKGQLHLVVKAWQESLTCKKITKDKLYRMFERDVFPSFSRYDKENNIISSRHITLIKHSELLQVIKKKASTAPETAKRIFAESQRVWKYAIAHDYTDTLITLKIDKGLIPNPKATHMPKITDNTILAELIKKIDTYHGDKMTRFLLLFVLRIPLRAQNLCSLRWSQIDFDKGTLTIKREELKQKDNNLPDFIIILPKQVVELLHEIAAYTSWGEWVFIGSRNMNAHINEETANKALRIMGFTDKKAKRKQTLHSFRGTFRSLAETHREEHDLPYEVMERCLDHHEKNIIARAYSHEADYSVPIGKLFQWWSDYIDKLYKKT